MTAETHYHIGSRIGKRYFVHQVLLGGMGEVYLCLDIEKNLPYALKTFQRRFINDIRIREAFKEEVRTWVALHKHPHIVSCHLMQVLDGQPFAVLDWIAGEEGRGTDLRGWLRSGPLNVKLALEVASDTCRGLIHVGEKQPGIVHRDLKPENILMAQRPVAKITDWGLARVVQRAGMPVEETGSLMGIRHSVWGKEGIAGTPPYMAPEQWRGELLDVRTDIYAVGCILYEMLTGRQPYRAATAAGYRRQHLEAPVPVLSVEDQASTELDRITACCLAKTADQRYQTVTELLQTLEAVYRSKFQIGPRILENTEEMTAGDLINRGVTYCILEDYDKALADLNEAILMGESLARAYINRGIVYTSLKRHGEAIADFDRAQELDPTMPQAYINRAFAFEALQRTNVALGDIARAIDLDPTYSQPYHTRGQIFMRLQQYGEALENFNRALQVDPYNSQTLNNRGLLYQAMGRYDDALMDFNRANEIDPTDVETYRNRGNILLEHGRYIDAQNDLAQMSRLAPDHLATIAFGAEVHKSLGQYDKAFEDYTRFFDFGHISPFNQMDVNIRLEAGHVGRALLFEELDQYEKAIIEYDQLINLDSTKAVR